MSRIRDRIRRVADAWFGREPSNYEAGRHMRVDTDFSPRMIGPNALADETLDLVRRRTRHLCDNHPLLKAAKASYINNVAGTHGIMIRPDTRWTELNKILQDRWYLFEDAANVARNQTFGMVQRQILGECFDGGDALFHLPITPAYGDEPAGIATDTIQAEQLDLTLNEDLDDGGEIRQGVEFDAYRRPRAYWVFPDHPADGGFLGVRAGKKHLVRIPAETAELMMISRRPGQVRGVPLPVAAVRSTRVQDGYEEANLQLALVLACNGIFIEGIDISRLKKGRVDADMPYNLSTGMPLVRTVPGMIGTLPQGAKVHQVNPSTPGPNFLGVSKLLAQHMASATETSYAEITDDYGDATFSSERARQLAKRKGYMPAQVVLHRATGRPTYRQFVKFEIAFNDLPLTAEQRAVYRKDPRALFQHQPMYPKWDWVNPQQEAQAADIAIKNGTKSRLGVITEGGGHFEDVIDEEVRYQVYRQEKYAAAGLKVPSDSPPSKPTPEEDDEEPSPNRRREKNRIAHMLNGVH